MKKGKGLLLVAVLMLVGCLLPSHRVFAQDKALLVYSNSLSDGRSDWLAEKAAEQGFDLTFVDAGGGDIYNRVLAEASSPQADIVFGLDESMFLGLTDENLLAEYVSAWAGELPSDANIGSGFFHPIVEQRIFMIYNPEYVAEEEVPANWQDLADNGVHQYRVPGSLGGGTNQKAVLSILLQYVDESGDLGIAQEGWDQVEAYLHNGYITPESEDQNVNFAEGKVPLSFFYSSGIPAIEEEYGFRAEVVNPEQGVITMREQVGIVNKGEDHDYTTAQEFVDWFGSNEVQGEWSAEFGTIPVLEDAQVSMNDRMAEIVESTEPMDVDWQFVRQYLDQWIEKIELELMP